jgi:hypothetical protein
VRGKDGGVCAPSPFFFLPSPSISPTSTRMGPFFLYILLQVPALLGAFILLLPLPLCMRRPASKLVDSVLHYRVDIPCKRAVPLLHLLSLLSALVVAYTTYDVLRRSSSTSSPLFPTSDKAFAQRMRAERNFWLSVSSLLLYISLLNPVRRLVEDTEHAQTVASAAKSDLVRAREELREVTEERDALLHHVVGGGRPAAPASTSAAAVSEMPAEQSPGEGGGAPQE